MYLFLLLEIQSSGGKAVGVMMLRGVRSPSGACLVMVPCWEDAAGGGKGQFWGVAAIPLSLLLSAPSPVAHFENPGQNQWPGPQAESSPMLPES